MLEEFVASFGVDETDKGGSKAFVRGETFVPHTVADKSSATTTESTGKIYKPAPKVKTAFTSSKEEHRQPSTSTPHPADSKGGTRSIDELKELFLKCVPVIQSCACTNIWGLNVILVFMHIGNSKDGKNASLDYLLRKQSSWNEWNE